MNQYLTKACLQLREELEDAFHHADSRFNMYTRSYLERLFQDLWECGDIGLKAVILAYDNISRIMIGKEAMAEYWQVEMLFRALLKKLKGNAVVKLKLDPRDPSMFKSDKLRKHSLDECVNGNALGLLNSDGAPMEPGVPPYSVPAEVPLPQMSVVINLLAIPREDTPAPA